MWKSFSLLYWLHNLYKLQKNMIIFHTHGSLYHSNYYKTHTLGNIKWYIKTWGSLTCENTVHLIYSQWQLVIEILPTIGYKSSWILNYFVQSGNVFTYKLWANSHIILIASKLFIVHILQCNTSSIPVVVKLFCQKILTAKNVYTCNVSDIIY